MKWLMLLATVAGGSACGSLQYSANFSLQPTGDGGVFLCITKNYRRGRLFEGGSASSPDHSEDIEYLFDTAAGEPTRIGDSCPHQASPVTKLPDGGKLSVTEASVSRVDAGGTVLWQVRAPRGQASALTVDAEHAFFYDDGLVVRLSLADGKVDWDRQLPEKL